jgi:hypothetical protein
VRAKTADVPPPPPAALRTINVVAADDEDAPELSVAVAVTPYDPAGASVRGVVGNAVAVASSVEPA